MRKKVSQVWDPVNEEWVDADPPREVCEVKCVNTDDAVRATAICIIAIVVIALVSLISLAANAQTPKHDHSTMGVAGQFLEKWKIPPKRETSCCSEKDCYLTTILQVDGKWVYLSRHTKKYEPLNSERLEELQSDALDSPDGQSYVCEMTAQDEMGMSGDWVSIICAVRGSGQ